MVDGMPARFAERGESRTQKTASNIKWMGGSAASYFLVQAVLMKKRERVALDHYKYKLKT